MLTHTSATRSTDLTSVTPVLPGHILLVEDDASIRDLVVEVLEHEGYTVTASVTPMEATRLLDQVGFDLVITDGFSTLPGSTFANTADVVRSARPIPVALFSAHTHDLDVAKAAGFSDLIAKPFDLDTLVHQVKMLLGKLPRHSAPDHSSGGAPWPFLAENAYADPARAPRERSFEEARVS